MRSIKRTTTDLWIGAIGAVLLAACARKTSSLSVEEAVSIAVDSYIYGYPLVTFDMVGRH